MNCFDSTLKDPVFYVESIGDDPRFPRAHLEVVFATSHHNNKPTPVGGCEGAKDRRGSTGAGGGGGGGGGGGRSQEMEHKLKYWPAHRQFSS